MQGLRWGEGGALDKDPLQRLSYMRPLRRRRVGVGGGVAFVWSRGALRVLREALCRWRGRCGGGELLRRSETAERSPERPETSEAP